MGQFDDAWEKILQGTAAAEKLASEGHFTLSANTLRDLGGKEPRLLAKWDTLADRPKPVAALGASLLPVRNGLYLLFRDPGDKAYFRFTERSPVARPFASAVDLPTYDTYPGDNLSEAQALDFAHLAGVFQDFAGDDSLRLTLRGRLFSRRFDLEFPHLAFRTEVDQVQIEIDAGFEGRESLLLVEAKRGSRDHAHIRQLWYPFLAWRGRTQKRVLPIFFTYANGQVMLTELGFTERFGEVEQIRTRVYALNPSPPPRISLRESLQAVEPRSAPAGMPFPQANDLDKLIDLILLLAQRPLAKEAIAQAFGMDDRQADYYANAGGYLCWVEKTEGQYGLTTEGLRLAGLRTRAQRSEAVLLGLLRDATLREIFAAWLASGLRSEALGIDRIAACILAHHDLSPATAGRRAGGILRWLEWVSVNLRVTGA